MKTKSTAEPEATSERRRLTGLFSSGGAAERAYQACIERGHEVGDVNVVVSEGTRSKLLKSDVAIKAELASRKTEGGELGGPSGGRVGAIHRSKCGRSAESELKAKRRVDGRRIECRHETARVAQVDGREDGSDPSCQARVPGPKRDRLSDVDRRPGACRLRGRDSPRQRE